MYFERTVLQICGDYALLAGPEGTQSEVAMALLPEGLQEGMTLIFENFEYRVKEDET